MHNSFVLVNITLHNDNKIIFEYDDGCKFMIDKNAFTHVRPVNDFEFLDISIHSDDPTTVVLKYQENKETGPMEIYVDASQLRMFFDREHIL
jgi:hypothetical protein